MTKSIGAPDLFKLYIAIKKQEWKLSTKIRKLYDHLLLLRTGSEIWGKLVINLLLSSLSLNLPTSPAMKYKGSAMERHK